MVGIQGCCQQDHILGELKIVPIYTSDLPTMPPGSAFWAVTQAGRQARIDNIRKVDERPCRFRKDGSSQSVYFEEKQGR